MALAELVSPHLPYLRRFSRALTGSQASGDAYVEALLEAIIADPSSIDSGASGIRTRLYALLCRLWESIGLNMQAAVPSDHWERAAQLKLANIAPRPRQAFLLTAVEGFSVDEAAEILETDQAGIAALLDEASREIGAVMATDVLIIEDEPLIAMDIEDIVVRLGHRVTGVARTRKEAIQLAGRESPGLILADIQLADGSSGIDAVNDLLAEAEVPVIFITAYPERLLTGDRPEPAFLITKPFASEMVKAMISQALFFDTRSSAARRVAAG
jgi:DNA-directed RNA polymerase specialized sigma24 family protein/CheY-like chemotaxis protein